jgi:hypothetical protein
MSLTKKYEKLRRAKNIHIMDRMDVVRRDNLIKDILDKFSDLVDSQHVDQCLSDDARSHYDNLIKDVRTLIGCE